MTGNMLSQNYIDFHGASHGHFLEYIVNTWIYNGPRLQQVFTELGTCHLPMDDRRYQRSKKIHCDHFTEFYFRDPKYSVPVPADKVIRISIDTDIGRIIHMINVMHRMANIPIEERNEWWPEQVRNNKVKLRNYWYAKLQDRDHGINADFAQPWAWKDRPAFVFPMESMYDFVYLCCVMQDCAAFLERKFFPDQEFYQTWEKFTQYNQGLQIWKHSKNVVEKILSKVKYDFVASVPEQALINLLLTRTVGIFDGILFEQDMYPSNTLDIWNHVQCHLGIFDQHLTQIKQG